jgi:hypothetical protein
MMMADRPWGSSAGGCRLPVAACEQSKKGNQVGLGVARWWAVRPPVTGNFGFLRVSASSCRPSPVWGPWRLLVKGVSGSFMVDLWRSRGCDHPVVNCFLGPLAGPLLLAGLAVARAGARRIHRKHSVFRGQPGCQATGETLKSVQPQPNASAAKHSVIY